MNEAWFFGFSVGFALGVGLGVFIDFYFHHR